MGGPLKLMAVLAHPDDETLGCGGTLARYSSEGIGTHVLTATRGQSGRHGSGEHPGKAALGRIREAEEREAARELGVTEVSFLDYVDGELDRADPVAAAAAIVAHLRRVRPHVVMTFGPDGAYGHPDHIAVSQLASAAVHLAADPHHDGPGEPHTVSKLYYIAWGAEAWAAYQRAFKTLTSTVAGVERHAAPWPEWAITTRLDCTPWWPRVWDAVRHHRTQMSIYGALERLGEDDHRTLWGNQTFYRAFSTVNGGREAERDLFEGLR
jgi:LmbE family N-acetylglucosaminyl deacetylase